MATMKRWWLAMLAPAMLSLGCLEGPEAQPSAPVAEELREGESALATAVFTGTVKDSTGKTVPGATVTINGVNRTTDTAGKYFVSLTAVTTGYILNVSKSGYGPVTEFLAAGKLNAVHILPVAQVRQINPTVNSVVETPDVQISIPANSLVDAAGAPASGTVTLSIATYAPLSMPGDFTAVNSSGKTVALESVGAFFVGATDSKGAAVNLGLNKTAQVFLRVPAQVQTMPRCVLDATCRAAMWRYDNTTNRWVEQKANFAPTSTGTNFTLIGGPASRPGNLVPTNGGLGTWNADIEKTNPACTIIEFVGFDSACYGASGLTVNLQLKNAAGTYITKSDTVASDALFIALYNTRANQEQEVGIAFPAGVPDSCGNMTITSTPGPVGGYPVYTPPTGGFTRFDSGAPWGGVGFPKDSMGNNIDLTDVLTGDQPCNSHVTFTHN
ncbi:carboxypeptidase regulatory-like domain-containing protein [Pyxidicoccus parkwayensis]|uniref:Carboxypeptidase regulatory-like domain-containing protein n=1 Tax=Pyxidicoccus parkwayensis TaxID=2813578 RepID=A0ABX7P287_9BACT|nr:carboxypeptidase-like regulatory domain-containing protein [Pyxidicoccus parkwaysis]QSQ24484.1 carboxypeptidase regulatory-like domain-containing protein [Pyxidicoccus parkwaysis]